MLTLAQNPLADVPPPSPLPPPTDQLSVWLFEGWSLGLILTGGAILLGFIILPRLGRGRLGLTLGLIGLALAAIAGTASWWVQTPREQLRQATRELVSGIARGDPAPAEQLLAPDVRLTLLGSTDPINRAQMLERIRSDMTGRYAVREQRASLSRLLASIDGPNVARTQTRIQAVHDATSFPVSTWWTFHWRRASLNAGPWQVVNLELQQFDGLPAGTRLQP